MNYTINDDMTAAQAPCPVAEDVYLDFPNAIAAATQQQALPEAKPDGALPGVDDILDKADVQLPIVRAGLDALPEGSAYHLVNPTLAELEAINDPGELAFALEISRIHGVCPRTRALLEKVEGEGILGWAVHAAGMAPPSEPVPEPPKPQRKPPVKYVKVTMPNLFTTFREVSATASQGVASGHVQGGADV